MNALVLTLGGAGFSDASRLFEHTVDVVNNSGGVSISLDVIRMRSAAENCEATASA